ncbi:MAG: ATP-binding protein [Carboxylicivirga sp.]|jgi:nitrogen fixation/metabolism regulation signal transduction histidine kinase|nr:ATP-binding protein [Carboxylicivirga sp.]
MSYKHFTVSAIVQSLLLAATPVLLLLIWPYQQLELIRYILFIAYIIQVWYLILTVRKTNRELSKFIQSFGFGDTTIHFRTRDKDATFQDLFKSFNQVVEAFRQLKMEKEKEYLFFETALKKIGVAIIVVNEHGNVIMTNDALLRLLNIKYLHRIDKLNQFQKGLSETLMRLKPNQQKLLDITVDKRLLQVALTTVMMKQESKTLRLIAFQDIRREIEQKELESWQKLIRVLTHEVINSLSPVNLISAGLKNRFETAEHPLIIDADEQQELIDALDAMYNRSKGLTQFVESYRGMAGLKSAQTNACNIHQLLSRIQTLFANSDGNHSYQIQLNCQTELQYAIDEKLVEQVLINLVKNSIEALDKDNAKIEIKAQIEAHQLKITVTDNGKGIASDELEKVCIPFYTTRQGGNGIGLALSKQVMRLHGGQLKVESKENKGTVVSLLFG